jgi:phosphomannomutase
MIVFGTDGWRGIIARDFTFDNIQLVALATARYLKKKSDSDQCVVIGYDTRFLSREFAHEAAMVLASQDINVYISDTFSSTPMVSFHTKQKSANLGVVITASHNPPIYNGYKIKGTFGGPSTPDEVASLEAEVKKLVHKPVKLQLKTFEIYENLKKIRQFDAKVSYLRHIKKKIDIEAINAAGFKVIYDPMYGAGINTMHELIPDVEVLHNEFNPSFGTLDHPEPIEEHLTELQSKIKAGHYDVGLATDGDADRLGAFDHLGNFVDSHKIFMILLKYLVEKKKKHGAVAKTVSLTSMVNQYCEKHKIKLFETAVGFKYICELMTTEKIIIGGEESGGLGTILHIPERDGIFNGMLLLEIMAAEKKSLKALCDELDEEFGPHKYMRRDVKVTQQVKDAILAACKTEPKTIGKFKVLDINRKDGFKFIVENGWLLIRASGTEPLIRFYAEAESLAKVNELLDEGQKLGGI